MLELLVAGLSDGRNAGCLYFNGDAVVKLPGVSATLPAARPLRAGDGRSAIGSEERMREFHGEFCVFFTTQTLTRTLENGV